MWIGIDFGTSNSCAALIMDDTIKLVADQASNSYTFPSSIYVEPNGKVLVGQLAENKQSYDVKYYQRAFKLKLGQEEPFILGEYQKYPVELVTEVIKKLKEEAEQQITQEPLSTVVITVPAKYEAPLRNLMQEAAQKAGFERIEVLEEPVAAAVYYASQSIDRVQDGETFLVYDLGGGTFDATLVRRKGLRYELLGAPDGCQIGGEDFDNSIYAHLLEKAPAIVREKISQPQYKADRFRVRNLCREIKHTLSTAREVRKNIPMLGQIMNYYLSRKQFIDMIDEQIDETIVCCEGLLKRAGIASEDVSCVLLVGGSCRIPYIRERLKEKLNIAVFPIDEPELSVSIGAAFYGDALDRATRFVEEVDILGTSPQFRAVLQKRLPGLFRELVEPLARGIAQKAVDPALRNWQSGQIDSLNAIQPEIERNTKTWIKSKACKNEIHRISIAWVQQCIPELTVVSDPICDRYQISRDILKLPNKLPQLEAGLHGTPIDGGQMVNADDVSSWVTLIVVVVMGIIVAHLHFLASLAGPVGFIAAAVTFYFGRGKTEEWIRAASLPIWVRKMVLSNAKIDTQVQNVQKSLSTSMVSELEKNKKNFEQFIDEIQDILKDAMHEQAVREARFIWLHTNEEESQVA